jgi:hypothetical protein
MLLPSPPQRQERTEVGKSIFEETDGVAVVENEMSVEK